MQTLNFQLPNYFISFNVRLGSISFYVDLWVPFTLYHSHIRANIVSKTDLFELYYI